MTLINSVIKVIYKNQISKRCQEVLPGFLITLYNLGEPFIQPLDTIANQMLRQDYVKGSPLMDFVNHVIHAQVQQK